ncbi:hypothetical protein BH10CHL1_BH10CHL1_35180 [soil metagenome]
MKLMTVGYEGLHVQEFIQILKNSKVNLLIDVRELPLSRKKGFSKTALSELLLRNNIEYKHLRDLGCPRQIRHDYRTDGNWDKYTKRFTDYLNTQDNAIEHLNILTSKLTCCLLCFEANAQLCHRSLVAEQLRQQRNKSIEIVHLRINQTMTSAVGVARPL